eukprot:5899824-Prymnesium_polylepis.2
MASERILKTKAKETYLRSDNDLSGLSRSWDLSAHGNVHVMIPGGRGMCGQQKQLWLVEAVKQAAISKHGSLEALRQKLAAKVRKKREREQTQQEEAAKRRRERIDVLPPPRDVHRVLHPSVAGWEPGKPSPANQIHIWLHDGSNGLVAPRIYADGDGRRRYGPTLAGPCIAHESFKDFKNAAMQLVTQELGHPELET